MDLVLMVLILYREASEHLRITHEVQGLHLLYSLWVISWEFFNNLAKIGAVFILQVIQPSFREFK